jgi:hypothetical protein
MSDDELVVYRNVWDVIDEFGRLPEAEGLVPLNIKRWPGYTAGVMSGPGQPDLDFVDRVKTPFWNLAYAHDYIEDARTQAEYSKRFRTVLEDTAYVNAMCELGDEVGSFAAGTFVNARVDHYLREMHMSWNKEYAPHEYFEMEQNARYCQSKGMPYTLNRGVGFFNEYASPLNRKFPSILPGTKTQGKRPVWSYKPFAFIQMVTMPLHIPYLRVVWLKVCPTCVLQTALTTSRVMFYGYFAYRSYKFVNGRIKKVKLLCFSSKYRKDVRYRYNLIRRLRSWSKRRSGEKGQVLNRIVCMHLNEHDFNG